MFLIAGHCEWYRLIQQTCMLMAGKVHVPKLLDILTITHQRYDIKSWYGQNATKPYIL